MARVSRTIVTHVDVVMDMWDARKYSASVRICRFYVFIVTKYVVRCRSIPGGPCT